MRVPHAALTLPSQDARSPIVPCVRVVVPLSRVVLRSSIDAGEPTRLPPTSCEHLLGEAFVQVGVVPIVDVVVGVVAIGGVVVIGAVVPTSTDLGTAVA